MVSGEGIFWLQSGIHPSSPPNAHHISCHCNYSLESPKFSRHAGRDPASRRSDQQKRNWIPDSGFRRNDGIEDVNAKISICCNYSLESPKFSRHAGRDPASRRSDQQKRNWIPNPVLENGHAPDELSGYLPFFMPGSKNFLHDFLTHFPSRLVSLSPLNTQQEHAS